MLRPGLAKRPAKNLHIEREVMLVEKPAPRVKAATQGMVLMYTALLPHVSEDGPAMMGLR